MRQIQVTMRDDLKVFTETNELRTDWRSVSLEAAALLSLGSRLLSGAVTADDINAEPLPSEVMLAIIRCRLEEVFTFDAADYELVLSRIGSCEIYRGMARNETFSLHIICNLEGWEGSATTYRLSFACHMIGSSDEPIADTTFHYMTNELV